MSKARLSPLLLPAVLVCFLRISPAAADTLGPEFRVNAYTTSSQANPVIASDSGGNFVVVWDSYTEDGSSLGVFGRRYTSTGAPVGAEFQVNTHTTDHQNSPSVASGSGGNFVVVWASYVQDGDLDGVFGQRYSGAGASLGAEFRVNTHTTQTQSTPSVASDSSGNFVVVWQSYPQDSGSYGIFGQRFASTGALLGVEFRVNSFTTDVQKSPSVASDAGGNFVVVWESLIQDGDTYGVFGKRYGSAGAPLGAEFRVNTYTTGDQRFPSVASDSSGNFFVVWQSSQDAASLGVFGQRYASTGARLGVEFRVNTYTTDVQRSPSVASDSGGNFVVVWQTFSQDGSGSAVFGQRYSSTGAPLGTEFRANTYTTGGQTVPSVASGTSGSFFVVWSSSTQDGDNYGVFGQGLCPTPLTDVSVSSTGSLSVCTTSTGGTVTVADTGGGVNVHQWFYRALPAGMYVPIGGQTGTMYVVSGGDFGGPGLYAVVCRTTPSCGAPIISGENVQVTVAQDNTPPSVTAPASLTATQTLCM